MSRPRWKKIGRDITTSVGRALLLLTAVSVGVFGVSAILTSYAIVTREISRNYAVTNPASATIEVEDVTEAMLATAERFSGIALAEARSVILARARVGPDWLPMLLFVADDFSKMRLNTFRSLSGAWPPPAGAMLIERTAGPVLEAKVGDSVLVKTPRGAATPIRVAGVVHDPALGPAAQEQYGYGYITRETLAVLGEEPVLTELRIQLEGNPADASLVESKAQALAMALRGQGAKIHEIRVPPPHQHPHQNQMKGVLFVFISFAWMALVLSAILVAAALAAMLAKQVREIGMMKAVGARTGQIALMYASLLLLLGIASTTIGLPSGNFTGRIFADTVAELLNFTIHSYAVPAWLYVVVISSGVLVPLLVAFTTILKASRVTVREAIVDFGVSNTASGGQRLDALLASIRGIGLPYRLAARNTFRRRGRLLLALALLGAGGAMFMTSFHVSESWERYIGRVFTERFYDVEFTLTDSTPNARITESLSAVAGIRSLELWGYSETAFAREGQIDTVRTYPDRGHGSFAILGLPPDTRMIKFPIKSGRWLRRDDTNAVVLNQMALGMMPTAQIGELIQLSIKGAPVNWTLVGVVEEVGSPAAAYVPANSYAAATGSAGFAQLIRIATSANSPDEGAKIIREIDDALGAGGVSLERGRPLSVLRTAVGEHVTVLIATLLATAVLLAAIGGLGLTSTMTLNVIERTREIGVMQTIGAAPGTILRIIVAEGVVVGALSWILAVLLSLPLSAAVGSIVGNLAFKTPLPLAVSYSAVGSWLALVVVLAVLATSFPGARASRLVIREALAYN